MSKPLLIPADKRAFLSNPQPADHAQYLTRNTLEDEGGLASVGAALPPGIVLKWSGLHTHIPDGWLHCNGQAVSRVTYAALHAIYEAGDYPWGDGDGTTTFNVPDLKGRHPIGASSIYALGDDDGFAEALRLLDPDVDDDASDDDETDDETGDDETNDTTSDATLGEVVDGGNTTQGGGSHAHHISGHTTQPSSTGSSQGGSGTPVDLTRKGHTHDTGGWDTDAGGTDTHSHPHGHGTHHHGHHHAHHHHHKHKHHHHHHHNHHHKHPKHPHLALHFIVKY